jgi:hypothetical protein
VTDPEAIPCILVADGVEVATERVPGGFVTTINAPHHPDIDGVEMAAHTLAGALLQRDAAIAMAASAVTPAGTAPDPVPA